jgi:hypothetical protein
MTMTALGLLASLALAPAGASADSASVNDNAAVQATAQPAASTPPAASTKPPMTDADLGTSVIGRFFRYQVAEMGQTGSPITDPNAPSSRRDGWTPQPENAPPMPFTEWPYGGATSLGVNRPNSVDSPLMVALGKTGLGQAMSAAHIQAYGWVDVGGNISTSNRKQGNSPGAYDYNPNTVQMDQAVLYLERTPIRCRPTMSTGVSASRRSMAPIIAIRCRTGCFPASI